VGDVSAEPSMEDILSSIKRIISEENEPAPKAKRPGPRAVPAPPPHVDTDDEDEVLELSDPVPGPAIRATAIPAQPQAQTAPQPAPEPILSRATADTTRSALDALSRLLVKPEPESDGTLEGLVREMLRPMLREWMDANLPNMVETLVAREIAKITGSLR
jgi:cell pole-organizing protein PopZ